MVATLVVSLPSVHTGGELVVDDGGQEQTYRGSRDDLVLAAFCADRRHEVRPVRSGYRVTLTFNLMLAGSTDGSESGPIEDAAGYLTEHFTTSAVSEYGGRDLGEPTRLVFLLDHEYTQRGLSSYRLKGADAERVGTLRAAAEQAGCDCVLALAEVKETWDVLPGGAPWYDDFDGLEPDAPSSLGTSRLDHQRVDDDCELNSLIDDEITLGWWVRPYGSDAETISLRIGREEVCAVTPSRSLTPYDTEYEGFMGNYGNTLDRWYRRAAVVVWPKEKAFAARAEAGSAWALRTLHDRIDSGDLDGARADAVSLEPFWRHVEAELLVPALQVAAGLRAATSARVVLAPFRLEMLTAEHATPLAAVAREYDVPWLRDVLARWEDAHQFGGRDRLHWIDDSLLPLIRALRENGARAAANHVVDLVWKRLSSKVTIWTAQDHPELRRTNLAELGGPLTRVLEAASDELGATITATLRDAGDTATELLVPALRAHRPPSTAAIIAAADDCRARLTRLIERPARADDDWSIDWAGCGCELCDHLGEFLRSATTRTDTWPLAKPGRQHIHRQIDDGGLPVQHLTRRKGRPYTLLLAKTDELFSRELEARRQAEADLGWVESVFG